MIYNGGTLPPVLAGEPLTTPGQFVWLFGLTPGPYSAPWKYPISLALDTSGNLYVTDSIDGTNSVFVIYVAGTVPGLSETLNGQTPVLGNAYPICRGRHAYSHIYI